MALSPLLTALHTKFATTSSLTSAFPGGFHLEEAPEGTAMPYLVYTVIAGPTDQMYGGVTRDDVQIQFTGWGIDGAALLGAVETFYGVLDAFVPALGSGNGAVSNCRRLNIPLPRLEAKDQDGNDTYQCYASYEFNVRP